MIRLSRVRLRLRERGRAKENGYEESKARSKNPSKEWSPRWYLRHQKGPSVSIELIVVIILTLLFLGVLVVVGLVGLGIYLGWFHLKSDTTAALPVAVPAAMGSNYRSPSTANPAYESEVPDNENTKGLR